MGNKKPYDKENTVKIPFLELVKFIDKNCDYKFCIIDDTIDEELMTLAANHGINLTGYKHVIETTGILHSINRHGEQSNDRKPLSIEDFLLVPFIIRNRDKVNISTTTTKRHDAKVLIYEKLIGLDYYYVEEIRTGKKVWRSIHCIKGKQKTPLVEGLFCYRGGYILSAVPLRLDSQFIFHSVSATN